jgi:hypothetical protein
MLDIFRNRPTSPQSVENINTAELATEDETENIGNNKPHE